MKRVFAILLALAMVLSLSVTAFAAGETGTITVTNATYGETYAVYKIFDASVKFAKDAEGNDTEVVEGIAYSIAEDDQFFDDLFKKESTTEDPYKNPYFIYNPNTHSVSKKEGVNDSELIKYLTDLVAGGSFETAAKSILAVEKGKNQDNYDLDYNFNPDKHETKEGPEITFENLPYGYYLITSTLGTTVTINSNTPDVEVIDKNQEPGTGFDKQVQIGYDEEKKEPIWADANSANIGDGFLYRISFTATNYDGDKLVKYYQIHDEKGDAIWAEFDSFSVVVDGEPLKRGYYLPQGGENTGNWEFLGDWSEIPEAERDINDAEWYLVHLGYDQFRITIPWLSNHTLNTIAGTPNTYSLTFGENAESKFDSPALVEITYKVVVEANAAIGGTTHGNRFNKAYATWTSEHETGSTPPDEVVTNVYGIGLLKDDSATGQNLAGAKFRIYKDKECTQPVYVIPTNVEGVYIVDSKGTDIEKVTGTGRQPSREVFAKYLDGYLAPGVEQDNYVVSQVNGKLAIIGLEAGKYYLLEVEAPDGYNALTTPVEIEAGVGMRPFTIFADKDGKVADIQQADGTHTEYTLDLTHTVVHNSKGAELPSTGGEGAFMLISIGTMIAIGFAVLMITQKKMSIYRD